jgi:hypothetical protein
MVSISGERQGGSRSIGAGHKGGADNYAIEFGER